MKPGAQELSNNFRLRQTQQHIQVFPGKFLSLSLTFWSQISYVLKTPNLFSLPDFSSPCNMTIEGSCCKRLHVKNYRKSKLNKPPHLSKTKTKTPPKGFGRYLACQSKKVSFWEMIAHQNPPLFLKCKAGKAGRVTNRSGLL